MRQVEIPRYGAPDVLTVVERPDPVPAEGQVRVAVRAAGLNFADLLARMGLYQDAPKPPMVVGYEVAGVVDAVGPGVDAARVGQRVLALTRFGGHSSAVVVPAEQAVALPERLSFEQGAALPVAYLTAHHMLVYLGNLHAGERVLVHSAGGAVGIAALQIAKARGAEVFGTASAGKHARLRELGYDHLIDYRTADFEAEVKRLTGGQGVHVILDAVGGASFGKSYRSLARTGRLFCFGISALAPDQKRSWFAAARGFLAMPWFHPGRLMLDNKSVAGVNLGHLWSEPAVMQGQLAELLRLVEAGTLEPLVDGAYPFDRAADAHRRMQERGNLGKVVLTP
jgi:NADPH:quinone reductase-like Zn-dependent oxidoreductase